MVKFFGFESAGFSTEVFVSFGGNLEDLSIIDVLQLLHATKKSGTLHLKHGELSAALSFREGFIVSVTHPDSRQNIGAVLMALGLIKPEQLKKAVDAQLLAGQKRKPLIATMVDLGIIEKSQAWKGLEALIESTVSEVVSWSKGQFCLDVEALSISDDYRFFPQAFKEEISVDTQAVLLNALRIFDEKQASQRPLPQVVPEHPETIDELQSDPGGAQADGLTAESLGLDGVESLKPAAVKRAQEQSKRHAQKPSLEIDSGNGEDDLLMDQLITQKGVQDKVVILFSQSGFIKHSIRTLALEDGIDAQTYALEKDFFGQLHDLLRRQITPIIVVDCMDSGLDQSTNQLMGLVIQRARRSFPEVPIIQLTPKLAPEFCAERFKQGIRAMIPRPAEGLPREQFVEEMKVTQNLLRACWQGIFNERTGFERVTLLARSQMSILKDRVRQMRDSRQYPDISLLLLKIVAETMERAVIFLVRPTDLLAVGSFGIEKDGEPEGIKFCSKIPLQTASIFRESVEQGSVFFGEADAIVHAEIYHSIAPPFSNQVLLLPLKTKDKTFALIYGDFAQKPSSPLQIESLEVLAHFGGLLLENSFLKRQVDAVPQPPEKKNRLRVVETL